MKTIYKYEVAGQVTEHTMPAGAKVLTFQAQGDSLFFWAEVDTDAAVESRVFRIAGTGMPIDETHQYIGTAQVPPFVWHLYELKKT